MVHFKTLYIALAIASTARGAPLVKRIAQVIADSTAKWEQACLAAGGSTQCNPLSVAAFSTLLAAAGPCDQQNAADNMMDLAHQLNSDASMISFTQLFTQQPRNSPDSLSVPYCQQAPRNSELNGLFQCQFQSVNNQVFVGNVNVGGTGTIPFGMSSPVSPAGSCPANPSGGIADGTQLTDITSNPGVPGSSGSSSNSSTTEASSTVASHAGTPAASSTSPSDATPAASATASSSGSSSFALQNGQAAQSLNAQFATLTANSSCTPGQNACVSGSFAQCVAGADGSGSFVLTSCNAAAGLTCAALPLVNSAGTSITCTTTSDAETRIANTGATGGLTGSN